MVLPDIKNPKIAANPVAQVVNPSSKKIENIYRNIEDEPLINKIKNLEVELLKLHPNTDDDYSDGAKAILKQLFPDFEKLMKVKYGPLGYLVKSDSETIIHLYGVDTDEDYYEMVDGSRIRISSEQLEKMVVAGGGKRFIGEEGLIANDPAETPRNAKLTADAVRMIMDSIKQILSG